MLTPARTWRVENVELHVKDVSSRAGAPAGIATLRAVADGSPLSLSVTDLRLAPLQFQATLSAAEVDASLAALYLPPGSPLSPTRGRVNVSATANHDATTGTLIALDAGFTGVELHRPGQASAYMTAPSARVTVQGLRIRGDEIELDRLAVDGGALGLEDTRLVPVRRWQIDGVALEARGLSSARQAPPGIANARAGTAGARVEVWATDIRLAPLELRATTIVRNVDLALLRLYLPPELPVHPERGVVNATVQATYDAWTGRPLRTGRRPEQYRVTAPGPRGHGAGPSGDGGGHLAREGRGERRPTCCRQRQPDSGGTRGEAGAEVACPEPGHRGERSVEPPWRRPGRGQSSRHRGGSGRFGVRHRCQVRPPGTARDRHPAQSRRRSSPSVHSRCGPGRACSRYRQRVDPGGPCRRHGHDGDGRRDLGFSRSAGPRRLRNVGPLRALAPGDRCRCPPPRRAAEHRPSRAVRFRHPHRFTRSGRSLRSVTDADRHRGSDVARQCAGAGGGEPAVSRSRRAGGERDSPDHRPAADDRVGGGAGASGQSGRSRPSCRVRSGRRRARGTGAREGHGEPCVWRTPDRTGARRRGRRSVRARRRRPDVALPAPDRRHRPRCAVARAGDHSPPSPAATLRAHRA